MRECGLHIGYAIYDCLAIEDNGWIAIHTILHRLRQPLRCHLHFCSCLIIHVLDAIERDPFRLFRIGWHVDRKVSFRRLYSIDLVDRYVQSTQFFTNAFRIRERILVRCEHLYCNRLTLLMLFRKRDS